MFVKLIKEFDFSSGEADVVVSDGVYELTCYCRPAENINVGSVIKEITALFAEDIMRIDGQECLIRKERDFYSYYLHGKVLNRQKSIIAIGELEIVLDKSLPKDIEQGEFVELKVQRLNCFLT